MRPARAALLLLAGLFGSAAKPPSAEWVRERWGQADPGFTHRYLAEVEKLHRRYPERFAAVPEAASAFGDTWRSIGPAGSFFILGKGVLPNQNSGRVAAILPNPTDPDTVYVLAAYGGLWKTTTFTSAAPTWTPLTDQQASTLGGALAFGRTPATLYLGMGDFAFPGIGGAFLTSTDAGATFTLFEPPGTPFGAACYDLKVDTSQAKDIVLAGTTQGLARSADGGATYTYVADQAGAAFAGRAVQSLVRTSAGWLASALTTAGAQGGLFLSTDLGVTWAAIPNPGNVYAGAGRATLAVGAPGDAVVYAFAANTGNAAQLDLFKSTDGGLSWTALGLGAKKPAKANPTQPDMNLLGNQADYNQMILVDAGDATRSTVYLGGQLSTAKTTDGGRTWTLLTDWNGQNGLPYLHADCHAAARQQVGAAAARIFIGADGGLTYSDDGGATWNDGKNRGLVTDAVWSLACATTTGDLSLVGLQDNGTRLRRGATSLWDEVAGGDGFGTGLGQAVPSIALSSYDHSGFRRATPPPSTPEAWDVATDGLVEAGSADGAYGITPLTTPAATADPTGLVFFTNTRGRIYRTSDGGATWQAVGTSTSLDLAPPSGSTIGGYPVVPAVTYGVAVSPQDLDHLAAASGDGLWLTYDGGRTPWMFVDLGKALAGWPGSLATVAYADDNTLYVASDTTAAAPDQRVAISRDGGSTWTNAGTGLPDVPINKLVVDPGDASGNTVYAATFLGVWMTLDGGRNWDLRGTGMPQTQVTDLYLAPDSSILRAGTWGRGVWELTTGAVSANIAAPSALNQGDTAYATAPAQAGRTYLWTVTGGTLLSGADQPRATFKAGPLGQLTLKLVVTGPGGASATSTRTIPIGPAPPADATLTAPPQALQGAGGLLASVPAQNGCTYAWTLMGGILAGAADGPVLRFRAGTGATLTVTVTVTNGAGLAATDSRTLPLYAPLSAVITAPAQVLPGAKGVTASVTQGPAGTVYFWQITGGTLTSPATGPDVTFDAQAAEGLLNLTVTASRGATATGTKAVLVSPVPLPVATLTLVPPVAASQGDEGLTAAVPPQGGATYAWAIERGGVIQGAANASGLVFNVQPAAADVVLAVTVTNALGVAASARATLAVVPRPRAVILPDQAALAPGAAGSARAPGLNPGDTATWTIAGGTLVRAEGNAVFYTAGAGPLLTVGLIVTNKAGAFDAEVTSLPVTAAGKARDTGITLFQPEPLAQGQAFEASVPAAATWTLQGGTLLATAGGSAFFQTGTGPAMTLTATDGTQTFTRTVALAPPADATLTVAPAPQADATGLTASVPEQPGATYAWTVTGGQITAGAGQNAITFTAGSGAYVQVQVQVTTPLGTASSARSFELEPLLDDLDGDGEVDPLDMALFVPCLGKAYGDPDFLPAADLDGDGEITDDDIALFKAALGGTP